MALRGFIASKPAWTPINCIHLLVLLLTKSETNHALTNTTGNDSVYVI